MALTKVTNSLVAVNAIQGTLIADNAITAVHIVNNAVTATQLADNAVTATKIQNGIIATDHLAADLITAAKIADDAISEEHLDATVISSLSTVTANSSDYVMLGDTSDSNNLKKALVSDFAQNEESPTFTGNVQVDGTLGVTGATTFNNVVDIRGVNGPVLTLGSSGSSDPRIDFEDQNSTNHAGSLFYDQDADTIRLLRTVSGSAVDGIAIDANGKVGIGTASPSAPLDVVVDSSVWTGEFTQSNTSNGDGVLVQVGSTAAADYALSIRSDAGNTSVLAAKADGKVGIGTFSPTHSLHVLTTDSKGFLLDRNSGSNAANLNEFSTHYSLSIKTRANGSYLNFAGDAAYSALQATDGAGSATAKNLHLNPWGGRVGIGTGVSTPAADLYVYSTSNPEIRIGTDEGSSIMQMAFSDGNGYFLRMGDAANNEDIMLRTYGNSHFNGGNVGIGTTSPNEAGFQSGSRVLSIQGAAADDFGVLELISPDVTSGNRIGEIRFGNLDGGSSFASHAGIRATRDGADNSSDISLWTTNAGTFGNKLQIDADGKVGIGTTSPMRQLDARDGDGVTSLGVGNNAAYIARGQDGTHAPKLVFDKSQGSLASPTDSANGNYLGQIIFRGYHTIGHYSGAQIDALLTGTNGTSDMPSALRFLTSADGSSTPTERMRILSTGDVLIGQTSQTGYTFAEKLVVGDGDANDGITIQSGSTHQGNLAFNNADGTTAHGRISYQHNSNYMAFMTNNAERMRIDGNGLLKLTGGVTSGRQDVLFNNGSMSLADNTVYTLSGVLNTGGLFAIGQNRSNVGITYDHLLVFCEVGTAPVAVANPSGRFGINSSGTDGQTNVYVSGGDLVIENKVGSTVTYSVAALIFQGN